MSTEGVPPEEKFSQLRAHPGMNGVGIEGGYGRDEGAGWSGSDTSREAGEKVQQLGRRQQEVYDVLDMHLTGLTCAEVERILRIGHGAASGALTRLHRAGRIVRLVERRDGQQIYLTPDRLVEQDVAPYTANRVNRHPDKMSREEIMDIMDRADIQYGYAMTVNNVRALLKEAWK